MTAPRTLGPRDDAAEASVLGAMLQDPEALDKAVEIVHPADFLLDKYRTIFATCLALRERNEVVDLVTVAHELMRRKQLEEVGGSPTLVALVDAVPTAANVAHHARIVKELAAKRRLMVACLNTAEKLRTDGADLPALVASLGESLDGISIPPQGHGPDLVCLADVAPEAVSWLWSGRLPRGKLSLIIGDPGQGKSCVTLDMAARVSRGLPWPDGGAAPLGGVVLLTAEDGLADTVRPRLDAMGADPRRVVALRGVKVPGEEMPIPFRLAQDLGHLENAINDTGAVLVVVDPVSAYLGRTDSYKDSEVRGVLAPLAALAERTGAGIVAVMHLTKDAQRKVLYRAQGSLAFVAASRAVFTVAEDKDDAERRLFLPVKTNLGPKPPGLGFRLIPSGDAARVEWDPEPVAVNADEALAGPEPPQERGERAEAREFLAELLASGAVASEDVKRQAKAAGIAERTLFRAKAELGAKATRMGGLGTSGRWEWELPSDSPKAAKAAKAATSAYMGHSGNLGNLSTPDPPAEGTSPDDTSPFDLYQEEADAAMVTAEASEDPDQQEVVL